MAWHPPSPTQVVDAGEQFANTVVETVTSTADAVVNGADDAGSNAADDASATTHTLIQITSDVAVNVATTMIGIVENSIGTTANAVAAIAASILPVVISVAGSVAGGPSVVISIIRASIQIGRSVVERQLAATFADVDALRQQTNLVDAQIRRLLEEIWRLRAAEQNEQQSAKDRDETQRHIMDNLEKAANSYAALLAVLCPAPAPSDPDPSTSDSGNAGAHLQTLELTIEQLIAHLERRGAYSLHKGRAVESLHRLRIHMPRTRHSLALAAEKRARLQAIVKLKPAAVPGPKPFGVIGVRS